MNELVKHIEILLLDNDCVIVPEFGGFMAHHVCAEYSEEEGRFIPPYRTIGFNPQLKLNDSLLVQSYVEAYDISYPEALRRIEDSVNELRQTLRNNGRFEFDGIGTVVVNEDSNLEFEPCVSGVLSPSFYALTAVDIRPLKDARNANVEAKQLAESVAVAEEAEPAADVTFEHTDAEAVEEEKEHRRAIVFDMVKLRNVAAAAGLLIVFALSSLPLNNGIKSTVQQCSIDTEMLMKAMPSMQTQGEGTLNLTAETPKPAETAVAAEEPKAATVAPKEETKAVTENQKSYVIVLASKVSRANADVLVARMHAYDVQDARVVSRANGNKVVCGSYASEDEARKAANVLRYKDEMLSEIWVMELNN